MNRKVIIEAAQDERESLEEEYINGAMSYPEYQRQIANIEHNLKTDLEEFEREAKNQ